MSFYSSAKKHLALTIYLAIVSVALCAATAQAQNPLGSGYPAWLAYLRVNAAMVFGPENQVPDTIVALGEDTLEHSSTHELAQGWRGMLGHVPRVIDSAQPRLDSAAENIVVIGTQLQVRAWKPSLAAGPTLGPDAYRLNRVGQFLLVEGGDARGVLYGAFALLREIAEEHSMQTINQTSSPWASIRWTNEWDNPNGTIERGYGGPSFFFEDGKVRADLSRAAGYARLLASVGVDGCTINNVNADPHLLLTENLKEIARIADVFRPYGVKLSLSVDIASPEDIGGLPTFDPLDPRVIAWWHDKVSEIYQLIPDFGGFLVKADSEGQPGPSHYGRSPADAANLLASALAPHGGVVLYRAFVYNHHLDWHDMKADRARAAYDIFHPLDGKFASNVIVQIKYGPIDFQVREPVSPLFAGLPHTNEAIELQITQEYLGQQRHLVYLAPMWKISLDTDMRSSTGAPPLLVRDLVSGRSVDGQHHTLGGFVGVADAGTDHWLGSPMALANLYSFGRLAWNPTLSAAAISDEWTRLTFGNGPAVRQVVNKLQMDSWHIYESYTGSLGIGTLTDILGPHFGPNPQSAERNGWGQWFRADHQGVGMDRTVATGTGYIGQYPPPLKAEYESLKTCPDDLLLFMHHVPYTFRLHSGKTVIQYIYDAHYWGAKAAAGQVPAWETLHGKIPDDVYVDMLKRLKLQTGHAIVWRDAITRYFAQMSGIPDDLHRVGNYPGRFPSDKIKLDGYTPVEVKPWEAASGGGHAAECMNRTECSASLKWSGPDGWYNIAVDYYDLRTGVSQFTLQVAGHTIDAWTADENLPDMRMNGNTETRHTVLKVALHHGDTMQLTGKPDPPEPAPFDYIEITPASNPGTGQAFAASPER
jgi:alpha-glucuronidase